MTGTIALRQVAQAWRELGWRHVAAALLVGSLFFLSNLRFFARGDLSGPIVVGFFLRHAIVGCLMVLAISAANRLVDHGAARLPTYAAAVALAAGLSDPIALHLAAALFGTRDAAWLLNGVVGVMIKGGLGTAAYVSWRDARLTSEALQRSQLQRAQTSRRLQETRLQTLQASVDPKFLFDALKQIAALQRHDPAAADALLNELIALLRALMPHERADASTVVREFALAVSYLRVVATAIRALTIEVSIDAGAGEARLPPMLLVPLLSAVLAAHSGAMPRLLLRAGNSPDRVRIQLDVSPTVDPLFLDSGELGRLRTQLTELYGEQAILSVQAQDGFGALLELPLESAWRADLVAPP